MFQRLSLTLFLLMTPVFVLPGSDALAQETSSTEVNPPPCNGFVSCLHQTLDASTPLEKAMFASQGIQYWTKDIPERDLYNLLMLRSQALIQLHLVAANSRFLQQAEADYHKMLEIRPTDYLPQTGLARIAELRGQLEEADRLYAEAIKSNDPVAYLEVADSRLRRSAPAPALESIDNAARLFAQLQAQERDIYPEHLLRMYQLKAQALIALNRETEALIALKQACAAGDTQACLDARRRERWIFF